MFNLLRFCRKKKIFWFDIVAETGNTVAKNGNNVEATFEFVERIVRPVAFDNVALTLLLVWTGHKTARTYVTKCADMVKHVRVISSRRPIYILVCRDL